MSPEIQNSFVHMEGDCQCPFNKLQLHFVHIYGDFQCSFWIISGMSLEIQIHSSLPLNLSVSNGHIFMMQMDSYNFGF